MVTGCATATARLGVVAIQSNPEACRATSIGDHVLYLTEQDVVALLSMDEAIPAVEQALLAHAQGTVTSNARRRLSLQRAELLSLESGNDLTGFAGHKNYLAVPGKGVLAHFFLYDIRARALVAIMRANELGRVRTGATTGVATKYLARAGARRHAIFGAGFQAETQAEAVNHVRPIEHVRVWSRTRVSAERIRDRLIAVSPGIAVELALDDPEELAAWADIVTVATRADEPVLRGAWLQPGVLVNAIGSNSPARAEVDLDVVRRADVVVVDSLEGARAEAGDLIPAATGGLLDWDSVWELRDVVAGRVPGRTRDDQIILFESQGLALEDLAVGTVAYRNALGAGVGRHVELD